MFGFEAQVTCLAPLPAVLIPVPPSMSPLFRHIDHRVLAQALGELLANLHHWVQ